MNDEKRTKLIAADIEKELREEGSTILVLSGSYEQNMILRKELNRRGIKAITHPCVVQDSAEKAGQADSAEVLVLCTESIISQDRPESVGVNPQTLRQLNDRLNWRVVILAVPTFFLKQLSQTIHNFHRKEMGGDSEKLLRIYDYVDLRVGLLKNYFRMRSYNYGLRPDALLNLDRKLKGPFLKNPSSG